MGVEVLISALAGKQLGLVTCEQMDAHGVTQRQRYLLTVNGFLQSVRKNVFRVSGFPTRWETIVLAAVIAAGPEAVASHATAGALWDLKHSDRHNQSPTIHVSAPRQLRLTGVTAHRRALEPRNRAIRRAIPVTEVAQTIVDLTGTLTVTQLGQCVDDALRRGLMQLGQLRGLVERAGGSGRRRLLPLREVLSDRLPGYKPGANDWEKEMDRRWDELGLPAAVPQYKVAASGHSYVLDRAIPSLKIGVEWNGFESHGTRSGFDHDSDKRADLTAAGWHVIDFTSRSSPARICRTVLAVVAQRQGRPSAA